jgi:hypothetical protein
MSYVKKWINNITEFHAPIIYPNSNVHFSHFDINPLFKSMIQGAPLNCKPISRSLLKIKWIKISQQQHCGKHCNPNLVIGIGITHHSFKNKNNFQRTLVHINSTTHFNIFQIKIISGPGHCNKHCPEG